MNTLTNTFDDFAMPHAWALIDTQPSYGIRYARVYTPNPWNTDEVRWYDWVFSEQDSTWRRSQGGSFTLEYAREDWHSRKARGHVSRDVIVNPFNKSDWPPCDVWASHFAGEARFFYDLIKTYNNDYPRQAKA